ncbi:hypothetical protein H7J88_10315 [Mycolicibacterium flavescens]|uniref:hypothetical protein n=1 Tax=Mycolicibacterium flavescens TaxID=1776 RepID=UPI001041DDDE|nr:hypothetical protein [Mycolicibacterium flavescens]MCV7280041.1 hypothetical protein [Mycolicibacterium flavescens]
MAFSAISWAYLDETPIDGRDSRGGGAALALRVDGSGGVRGICRGGNMRGDGRRMRCASGDTEGPRHAGNGYAGERAVAIHDVGTLLSHKNIPCGM